jgi:hypothetical protein
MADEDRVQELQEEVERLMHEVERYRSATEDALQQLDWCIGYFTGSRNGRIAKSLGVNRNYIRRNLLKRPELSTPNAAAGSGRAE